MMGRATARNMQSFLTKINLEKLVHLLVLLKRNLLTMHGHVNVKKPRQASETVKELYRFTQFLGLNRPDEFRFDSTSFGTDAHWSINNGYKNGREKMLTV